MGRELFSFLRRFFISESFSTSGRVFKFIDILSPRSAWVGRLERFDLETLEGRLLAFSLLVPPCVAHAPVKVGVRPKDSRDVQFWQYPAITELKAWEAHSQLNRSVDSTTVPISTYLGLPWATYIDKAVGEDEILSVFKSRISGYRALASQWGLSWGTDVRLHTVCQHIYWERLVPVWQKLHVTDVHLSHCTEAAVSHLRGCGIRAHSWPLSAANAVNEERRAGLSRDRSLLERKIFASFIGCYLSHYRSQVRLELEEEVKRSSGLNIVFQRTDAWHFEEIVYGYQVNGKHCSSEEASLERERTWRYNQVLSDSIFSLCPEGAGPNTIRLWESLAAGAIPVVIAEDWIPPKLPPDIRWERAVVFVDRREIPGLIVRLKSLLERSADALVEMQAEGARLCEYFQVHKCF